MRFSLPPRRLCWQATRLQPPCQRRACPALPLHCRCAALPLPLRLTPRGSQSRAAPALSLLAKVSPSPLFGGALGPFRPGVLWPPPVTAPASLSTGAHAPLLLEPVSLLSGASQGSPTTQTGSTSCHLRRLCCRWRRRAAAVLQASSVPRCYWHSSRRRRRWSAALRPQSCSSARAQPTDLCVGPCAPRFCTLLTSARTDLRRVHRDLPEIPPRCCPKCRRRAERLAA